MMFRNDLMSLYVVSTVAVSCSTAMAQIGSPSMGVEPFAAFVAGLRSTTTTQMMAKPFAAVKTTDAAEEMRQHLLKLYTGVSVSHSYDLRGQIVDCVPANQQPSVRLLNLKTIAAVPASAPPSNGKAGTPHVTQQDSSGVDTFGNKQVCEAGSIPMRRITLDEVSRFPTLKDYFAKGPNGAGRPHSGSSPVVPDGIGLPHKYAIASQDVANYGGAATLSLINAPVDTSLGEEMSLSQLWFTGGNQTAEIGIQTQPNAWWTNDAVLFIYWTANGYNEAAPGLAGAGCYNLSCGAFVQTSSNWTLGGTFPNYGADGSEEVTLGYEYWYGNWWMYVDGDWVGYYPGSIYNGGQMSSYSTNFQAGGETATASWNNPPYYPPMGDVVWAAAGYPWAAYQRFIYYIDGNYYAQSPALNTYQPNPNCYSISSIGADDTSGTFFFFGGPGNSAPYTGYPGASC